MTYFEMKNSSRKHFLLASVIILLISGIFVSAAAQDSENDSLMRAFNETQISDGQRDGSSASRYNQQSKLTASDGANDDNFGVDVAIDGDTAVVGSCFDDVGANADQGSAYVFLRTGSTWTLQQKLTASDGAAGDSFGCAVAITNTPAPQQTVIMVGAFGDDIGANANQGSVYVFVRASGGTSWAQQGKLTASDGAANDVFGNSVSLSGGFAVIGSNGDDIGANVNQGAAFVFVRNGTIWEEEQKLVQTTNAGAAANGNFGWSVAISGTIAIIGSNYTASADGRIVIFERVSGGNTWVLTASSGPENNGKKFGYSVGISGETAIAGAYLADVGANADQGEARIIYKSSGNWAYGSTLTAPDGIAGDNFGFSVAVASGQVFVGETGDDIGVNLSQGAVHIFGGATNVWTHQQKVTDSTGGVEDLLGWSIAVSGDTLIAGAVFDDVGPLGKAGSASVFKFSNAAAPFDFDGDSKTDLGIFRPTPGEWWINRSSTGATFAVQFGTSTDRLTPADFTGDGKADIAFWRPSTGQWFILRSEDSSFFAFPFGANGDTPVPADFDGDGKADAAVFRSSIQTWYISKSSGGTDIIGFGAANDKPVISDYDADGKADIAIFRANGANGEWWIRRSSNGSTFATVFGTPTDKPTQGDFTGDGKADVAFFRPSNGNWFVLRSEDSSFYSFPFGTNNDVPSAGDYDGDGRFDAGVFRPSNNTWFINRSTAGTLIQQFGAAGDRPIPNVFVP